MSWISPFSWQHCRLPSTYRLTTNDDRHMKFETRKTLSIVKKWGEKCLSRHRQCWVGTKIDWNLKQVEIFTKSNDTQQWNLIKIVANEKCVKSHKNKLKTYQILEKIYLLEILHDFHFSRLSPEQQSTTAAIIAVVETFSHIIYSSTRAEKFTSSICV